ncbi:hypothetical protein F4819DRAFT_488354 [Hypoxylon fuscum]|nr:hypothetical protein F4819DRAFT_488354 [Hypoxylon fuscum]
MRSATVTSILLLAAGVTASPFTSRAPAQYVSLSEEPVAGGDTLEFLGPDPATNTNPSSSSSRSLRLHARARCAASPQPTCSASHNASNELCAKLVDQLYGSSRSGVPPAPRQVCYKSGDALCCTSWSAAVAGLTQGDLADNANAILQQCVVEGISGQINGVSLKGKCVDQCLSDRGKGCT